jgi:hypothetical protein
MIGATISKYFKICAGLSSCLLLHVLARLMCWRCSCIILLGLKISWAPVHELLHGLSMLLYHCFTLPAGIFHWVILPLDQILKIFFRLVFLPTRLSSMHSIYGFSATGNCFSTGSLVPQFQSLLLQPCMGINLKH